MNLIAFIDTEINYNDKKIIDFGAIKSDNSTLHSPVMKDFQEFILDCGYICGHNIIHHDLKYIEKNFDCITNKNIIDTLYLSPLLFPEYPYHKLLKDDKIYSETKNNPLNDAKKAMNLFYDEVNAFNELPKQVQRIYYSLLSEIPEFSAFFNYINYNQKEDGVPSLIYSFFDKKICLNADLAAIIQNNPIELTYALAFIGANKGNGTSITPAWVLKQYPNVENVIKKLCATPCKTGCDYCNNNLDIHKQLKHFFNFDDFRTYEGEPLQEKAVKAAVQNKSLIAIFPTGGGKSLTFQLPALISGRTIRGLTVIVSPLQSLMKDQIDNLEKKDIVDAVSINGLLNPIERAQAIERIKNGVATMLYISPEQLRSKTIENLLLSRNVVRFVIDEAHCFSAWGQDFRVDYLYIGDFIKKIQQVKNNQNIAISCFTATAKPKVIMDIKDYFKNKLNLELETYSTSATRENLRYQVRFVETPEKKYNELRSILLAKECSAIVYTQSVRDTRDLAERLKKDGFSALPYNGRMDRKEKIATQEKFINNEINIIVATSAFGMGVDKQDIELVVHYSIPPSLEDYMQESGRAAREQSLNADCYILFSPNDTDAQFVRLNQAKLTMNEIQQVWKVIKDSTRYRPRFSKSALEIARKAGWDKSEKSIQDLEIKVKTALMALERANYIKRGQNISHVYANSINAASTIDAKKIMKDSGLFDEEKLNLASKIISSLISSRSISFAGNKDAKLGIDYLADTEGIEKAKIVDIVNQMRLIGLLTDNEDIVAVINDGASKKLNKYIKLENYLLDEKINDITQNLSLKSLNEEAQNLGIDCKVGDLRKIFNYWKEKSYIEKRQHINNDFLEVTLQTDIEDIKQSFIKRSNICKFALKYLIEKVKFQSSENLTKKYTEFSVVDLFKTYENQKQLSLFSEDKVEIKDIENALYYMNKIDVISLDGGFLVIYNAISIERLIMDNKIKYKKDDYKFLDEYYKQKIQQIHIIAELLNILVNSYNKAIGFIKDYFQLGYKDFVSKYFKGCENEIAINMTPKRYKKLFGELSNIQKDIILDTSPYIVVIAGPGSGKTRTLVHKLAALLTLEDIKSEQLLMLTFSRAAATEFKSRLKELIGNAAAYVEIKTFHSYCFDLLGRIGTLEKTDKVISEAVEQINKNEVEPSKIAKAILVIDEAQDMSEEEFLLIDSLMQYNEGMRIIAVGDDDQNIYEFRGSNSKYFASIVEKYGAKKYEMVENYRSCSNVVNISNLFAKNIKNRIKQSDCIPLKSGGTVNITKYKSSNLENPLVEKLISDNYAGTIGILTVTNNEALRLLGLLNKNQIRAKLIQSLDGLKLLNLAEISFFYKYIKRENPIQISDKLWTNANNELKRIFERSTCLKTVSKMIDEFSKTNPYKYLSDFESFFSEANYEDFDYDNDNAITISTIHKSKGHEYDNVYMMLNSAFVNTDENLRKIYVGITRAKNNLSIHYCNNQVFDNLSNIDKVGYTYDKKEYDTPEEIMLSLGYRDVVLNYFLDKQKYIRKLRSGDELSINGDYLCSIIDSQEIKILKFSAKCRERINRLVANGYKPSRAKIRFLVWWKSDELDSEALIILPDVEFKKKYLASRYSIFYTSIL